MNEATENKIFEDLINHIYGIERIQAQEEFAKIWLENLDLLEVPMHLNYVLEYKNKYYYNNLENQGDLTFITPHKDIIPKMEEHLDRLAERTLETLKIKGLFRRALFMSVVNEDTAQLLPSSLRSIILNFTVLFPQTLSEAAIAEFKETNKEIIHILTDRLMLNLLQS